MKEETVSLEPDEEERGDIFHDDAIILLVEVVCTVLKEDSVL